MKGNRAMLDHTADNRVGCDLAFHLESFLTTAREIRTGIVNRMKG